MLPFTKYAIVEKKTLDGWPYIISFLHFKNQKENNHNLLGRQQFHKFLTGEVPVIWFADLFINIIQLKPELVFLFKYFIFSKF